MVGTGWDTLSISEDPCGLGSSSQFSVLCCSLQCSFVALSHFCLGQSTAWEK